MNGASAHAIITLAIGFSFVVRDAVHGNRALVIVFQILQPWSHLIHLIMAFEQVPLDKFADTFATAIGKISSVQSVPHIILYRIVQHRDWREDSICIR